ncbi:hypothetical protein J5568_03500 [Streptococcus suis]|uniref:Uncharacterized protein n=1 Tax=Streptococcus suis TaxID=1307 RepID=A0A0Z8RV20_STRSU|nr:hypothetical protein [Streptococcus suis]MBO4131428.1 hypothetical protein [Streptococcus suis]MBO4132909.1 hypothetical protein [Streptococcus suis]MCK4019950.1 hypothetical protein [Streptococcus suis]NQI84474.1 hypothetical protein [Streptococcus suis]NQK17899.1 hypothetical protein [Streptococcus suis]
MEDIKQKIAERYNLPPLIAERLKGETIRELEVDAKQLSEYFQIKEPDPIPPLKCLEPIKNPNGPWAAIAMELTSN